MEILAHPLIWESQEIEKRPVVITLKCKNEKVKTKVDIAINLDEFEKSDEKKIYYKSQVADLGDLSIFYGYKDFDFTGYTIEQASVYDGKVYTNKELKEIDPPKDVQETMNKIVKAENEKMAAIDFATAVETRADGEKRSEIKKAEGVRTTKILEAEGESQAIALVNEAAEKYFVGNAQLLRRIQAVETALSNNSKIIVPSDKELINVIGDMAGIMPIPRAKS